jgi:hypothetical protein
MATIPRSVGSSFKVGQDDVGSERSGSISLQHFIGASTLYGTRHRRSVMSESRFAPNQGKIHSSLRQESVSELCMRSDDNFSNQEGGMSSVLAASQLNDTDVKSCS